jgi:DNA-binding protein H-NS
MATIDLSSYNLGELKGLQYDIEREIKDRQQQEVRKAREEILAIAQDVGISVEELLANTAKKSKTQKGVKVRPQYQNPADNSQTWSGRGRQPKWVAEGLASGKKLDDFRIQ